MTDPASLLQPGTLLVLADHPDTPDPSRHRAGVTGAVELGRRLALFAAADPDASGSAALLVSCDQNDRDLRGALLKQADLGAPLPVLWTRSSTAPRDGGLAGGWYDAARALSMAGGLRVLVEEPRPNLTELPSQETCLEVAAFRASVLRLAAVELGCTAVLVAAPGDPLLTCEEDTVVIVEVREGSLNVA